MKIILLVLLAVLGLICGHFAGSILRKASRSEGYSVSSYLRSKARDHWLDLVMGVLESFLGYFFYMNIILIQHDSSSIPVGLLFGAAGAFAGVWIGRNVSWLQYR